MHGVNSVRHPWTLPEDQFKWGQNITVRGGVAQTRSGFSMRLSLPSGNFQGGIIFNANKQAQAASSIVNPSGVRVYQQATIYTPEGTESAETELSYLLFAVSGKVYYAPFPLTQPKHWGDFQLSGISLDANVNRVNFVLATQSAQTSSGGDTTITPSHRIVVIQDGVGRPAWWDGSNKQGSQVSDIPLGFWMAFSGQRLWVANGNIISASDLANPLGWKERTTGSGRGDFSVPRPVTAMQDYVGQNNDSRLYVFTDRATYSLASGILDRAQWVNTANFQNVLYPTIGCIAGKSIAFQAGMMWWYSVGGLVSADVAASSYLSSQVLYKDIEMAKAKRLMAADLSGICSVAFENYLLCSVPYLEPLNSVTMALDYAAASEWNQSRSPAWAGVWTGIRPIEWVSGVIGNEPRVFALSVDYGATNDGSFNHVWEAFQPHKYDTYLNIKQDGSTEELINRIYCQMETALLGDGMDFKQLVYGELDCSQIAGTVDVKVSYRGLKGTYQQILNTRLLAATDSYQYKTNIHAPEIDALGFLQSQHRRLVTESVNATSSPKSCESDLLLNIDKAFSFLIEWCGSLGIESIRMFQDPWQDKSTGLISNPETQYCTLGEDGSTVQVFLPPAPKENPDTQATVWFSTQTFTAVNSCPAGTIDSPPVAATATASATSYISQEDANAQALAKATAEAQVAAQNYRLAHPCGPIA
jgi:hypothetical protein